MSEGIGNTDGPLITASFTGDAYLGVDVGSVSVNLALTDRSGHLIYRRYLRSRGAPVTVVIEGLREMRSALGEGLNIAAVCTTGSGRRLLGRVLGADQEKNEITAHAFGALAVCPDVEAVLEIGGQDSKLILLSDGVVTDFAMNTVCAAGTGSFLDQQAARLGISIGELAVRATRAARATPIAGRCGVFAESDMIHKQQAGHPLDEILAGLCDALVRNYLNNVGRGKEIRPPAVFQGGVAANRGIRQAFERRLGFSLRVPEHYDIMGALGAARIARAEAVPGQLSRFRGFDRLDGEIRTRAFVCADCANNCEIIEIIRNGRRDFCIGGRCGKFDA